MKYETIVPLPFVPREITSTDSNLMMRQATFGGLVDVLEKRDTSIPTSVRLLMLAQIASDLTSDEQKLLAIELRNKLRSSSGILQDEYPDFEVFESFSRRIKTINNPNDANVILKPLGKDIVNQDFSQEVVVWTKSRKTGESFVPRSIFPAYMREIMLKLDDSNVGTDYIIRYAPIIWEIVSRRNAHESTPSGLMAELTNMDVVLGEKQKKLFENMSILFNEQEYMKSGALPGSFIQSLRDIDPNLDKDKIRLTLLQEFLKENAKHLMIVRMNLGHSYP